MEKNKVKKEYCFTLCQVGCNKETKHFFIDTENKKELCLVCSECVLKETKVA